ncbi:MAG: hypothetical protein D6718_05275 [Acidobacteria bacterium]|nr:MAG: hypothetical protein D6718_05275 [Acidobacteriota bacterium]
MPLPPRSRAPILAALLFAFGGALDATGKDCSVTSVGKTPLDDLGPGLYQGFEGGLYPGGVNTRPAKHDADLDRVGRTMLLDPAGKPDAQNGRIVLMSVGMSNATMEFSVFKQKADADPRKNDRVVIVDAAEGGQASGDIADPNAQYWQHVDDKLAAAGVTPLQVQAVWLKEARRKPIEPFPEDARILRDQLRVIVRIIKSRYPNTRAVYLDSRIYAGYATTQLNPEPYAYQSGFSVKWLIEEQLSGSPALNFDPARGPVRAPWLSWGPYLWADGLVPRSDGLTWRCVDFNDDGTHPSPLGRDKVSDMLLAFFESDPTTVPWFVDCDVADPGVFGAPPEVHGLLVERDLSGTRLSWESLDPVSGLSTVYDVIGGDLGELRADRGFGRAACLATGLPDSPWTDGQPDPLAGGGLYWLVRGRNGCGIGSYGDGTATPDPRDDLDGGTPACP